MNGILIVGSDSFIASLFVKRLENKEIMLFSRRRGNANEVIRKDLFHVLEKDMMNSSVVINFAAIVHQPKLSDDELYKRVNTELPIHLAGEARKAGVKHFIQMSTVAVYGNVNHVEINTAENPINVYGRTKLAADNALLAMQDDNFKITIIRPPMVYGGGLAPGNMQKLIKAVLKKTPMPFGNINNSRDFISINNLIEAINSVIQHSISGIVLPTDRRSISTNEIIKSIGKASNKKVILISFPKFLLSIVRKLFPNIYNKVFGSLEVECNLGTKYYTPKNNFNEGIESMVKAILDKKKRS